MELFVVLLLIIPGLLIYSFVRHIEGEKEDPEYVILIRGIFYSLPFLFIILIIIKSIFGFVSSKLIYAILNRPSYILIYFLMILVYSFCANTAAKLYRTKVKPLVNTIVSKLFKAKAHESGYSSGWKKISHEYMYKYDFLVGRLYRNRELIAFGQIIYISDSSTIKDICFRYQTDYMKYFPDDGNPILQHICTYIDMDSDYILDLYDGRDFVRKLPKLDI